MLDSARELHLSLPGTALTYQLYQAVETRGGGNEGSHALVKALEALTGIEVKKQ